MRLPLNANTTTVRAGALTTRVYYGWVLVGALGITETISWGVLYYAFSVFLTPMESDLSWSRAETTGAFSLALVLCGFAAIPVGRWLDRRSARGLMTGGSCIGVLLVLAWAHSDSLLAFYVLWALIGLVMATILCEPAFAVVAVWFDRQRTRALTGLTLIAGFLEHRVPAARGVAHTDPGLAISARLVSCPPTLSGAILRSRRRRCGHGHRCSSTATCRSFMLDDGNEASGVGDWSEGGQGDAMYDLATLTLAHEEHLDDAMAGYGGHIEIGDSRLLTVAKFDLDPVVGEHGHGAPTMFPQVAVLNSLSASS